MAINWLSSSATHGRFACSFTVEASSIPCPCAYSAIVEETHITLSCPEGKCCYTRDSHECLRYLAPSADPSSFVASIIKQRSSRKGQKKHIMRLSPWIKYQWCNSMLTANQSWCVAQRFQPQPSTVVPSLLIIPCFLWMRQTAKATCNLALYLVHVCLTNHYWRPM